MFSSEHAPSQLKMRKQISPVSVNDFGRMLEHNMNNKLMFEREIGLYLLR